MKKKKWSRVLPVLLVMVTVISLLPGCGRKRAEKEDAETITVYLWSTNLYEKYAPYIQEQLPDRKSTRLNSSHLKLSRMPSSA